jgi:hypothetical protein
MNRDELKAELAPLKDKYRSDPASAKAKAAPHDEQRPT